ncbi:MAG: hypothetical protein AAB309_00370 [Deltaproteobacteria bacterium]
MRSQDIIFSLLFLLIFISFYGCGKGVEVGLPGIAPPLQTTISGQVETVTAVAGQLAEAPATVSLVDASGKTVATAPLREDGTFTIATELSKEQGGFFKIVIERKGDIDLESAVAIEAGKDISPGQLRIDPVTTLALFLGEAYNDSEARAFKRALTFYTPILKSLDPAVVKAALLELQNPSQDFDTFIGGANAFRKVLEALFTFVEPQPVGL